MAKDQQEIRRKLRILAHAAKSGDVSNTCRYFGIGRASLYRWRFALADHGEAGLANRRSVPQDHLNRTPKAVTEKVLQLRREYQLGSIRIACKTAWRQEPSLCKEKGMTKEQSTIYVGIDVSKDKLAEWEQLYHLARPHGAHNGKAAYEALREKL